LLYSDLFLDLLFDPEDGGNMLFWNTDFLWTTVLFPRRQNDVSLLNPKNYDLLLNGAKKCC
jgi:hypothetical protein